MSRLEQLEEFLRDDPNDPFNYYALAIEYLKHDTQKSRGLFEQLVRDHPDYLPTYYAFAQLLTELNDSRADDIFKKGIDLATRHSDTKTAKELGNAYSNWLYEQS